MRARERDIFRGEGEGLSFYRSGKRADFFGTERVEVIPRCYIYVEKWPVVILVVF